LKILIRSIGIGAEGAAKIGEDFSKLLNLSTLDLNFKYAFSF
jgi:hypothetical protein